MTEEMIEEYWSRFQATFDENQEYVVGKDLLNDVQENIKRLPDLGEVLELGDTSVSICDTSYFHANANIN